MFWIIDCSSLGFFFVSMMLSDNILSLSGPRRTPWPRNVSRRFWLWQLLWITWPSFWSFVPSETDQVSVCFYRLLVACASPRESKKQVFTLFLKNILFDSWQKFSPCCSPFCLLFLPFQCVRIIDFYNWWRPFGLFLAHQPTNPSTHRPNNQVDPSPWPGGLREAIK